MRTWRANGLAAALYVCWASAGWRAHQPKRSPLLRNLPDQDVTTITKRLQAKTCLSAQRPLHNGLTYERLVVTAAMKLSAKGWTLTLAHYHLRMSVRTAVSAMSARKPALLLSLVMLQRVVIGSLDSENASKATERLISTTTCKAPCHGTYDAVAALQGSELEQ